MEEKLIEFINDILESKKWDDQMWLDEYDKQEVRKFVKELERDEQS